MIDELANIETWAAENNLRLNQAKSVEVVFRDPVRKKPQVLPVPHASILRTETIKILGVTLTSHFSMRPHVDLTLTACSQTLFALKTLRAHGMQTKSLQTVFKSVALSKLQYSSQAWRGFTTCQDRERLEGFMRKSKRAGFYPTDAPSFNSICAEADNRLFTPPLQETQIMSYMLVAC